MLLKNTIKKQLRKSFSITFNSLHFLCTKMSASKEVSSSPSSSSSEMQLKKQLAAMVRQEVSSMIKQGFLPPDKNNRHPLPSPPSPRSHNYTPPPPPTTLYDMITQEQQNQEQTHESDELTQQVEDRVSKMLTKYPFWVGQYGLVEISLISKDGVKICLNVDRSVLVNNSRFFAVKLNNGRGSSNDETEVEISDCDDVEVYVEILMLMYCVGVDDDLKRRLLGKGVSKILALLKVSASLMFNAGIVACIDYLELVPWSVNEEKQVLSILRELELPDNLMGEILKRLSTETPATSTVDDVITGLVRSVLQGKDDKARREMRTLVLKLIPGDALDQGNRLNCSRESLYHLCRTCLSSLVLCVSEATCVDESKHDRGALMGEITQAAENFMWIGSILTKKKIAEDYVKLWADQKDLAALHSKIHKMYRHQISSITCDLCISIGRGKILVPKETRISLLSTWLEPLYEDYGWMSRSWKSDYRTLFEEGLSQTILTLPWPQQQSVLFKWLNAFLRKGNDCPNIKKAFEVWWRRAFNKQRDADCISNSGLQIAVLDSLS